MDTAALSRTPTATNVTDFGDINRLESNTVNPLESDGFNLHIDNRICYTMGGKCEKRQNQYTKSPQVAAWGLFYSHIAGGLNP